MGWGFRRSIKIAPGVRVNFSKSGVSTSIGGKGFTYNTRGRLTTSIPGTGIRYTQNLKARRTSRPIASAVSVAGRLSSTDTEQLSKRELATREFVEKVKYRVDSALLTYFLSHGVYVRDEDVADAVTLEDHQAFLATLEKSFDLVTRAVRLAKDIGTISLAEKEKAMLAVYEVEKLCTQARGECQDLSHAMSDQRAVVLAYPPNPTLAWPFVVSMVGCVFLVAKVFAVGLPLLLAPMAYAAYKVRSFKQRRAQWQASMAQADARLDSLVEVEVSPRPMAPEGKDSSTRLAVILSSVAVVIGLAASIYRPDAGIPAPDPSASSTTSDMSSASGPLGTTPTPAPTAEPMAAKTPSFLWLTGKYPSDVVQDPRFKAAFGQVPADAWAKFADRIVVTNTDGIRLKDGYFFGSGCKAHFCASDQAAFAINAATGKGALVIKESATDGSDHVALTGYTSPGMPVNATPLATWAKDAELNLANADVAIVAPVAASTVTTSFDCSKARSDAEKLICSDPVLAAADVELAGIYARAKAGTDDQAAFKAHNRQAWNYRERQCHDQTCLTQWYATQKTWLLSVIEGSQKRETAASQ